MVEEGKISIYYSHHAQDLIPDINIKIRLLQQLAVG
jgi:hypothetical protein